MIDALKSGHLFAAGLDVYRKDRGAEQEKQRLLPWKVYGERFLVAIKGDGRGSSSLLLSTKDTSAETAAKRMVEATNEIFVAMKNRKEIDDYAGNARQIINGLRPKNAEIFKGIMGPTFD